jgi:hypothetical protein
MMARCEACSNSYERLMKIELDGVVHFFDCFECAIQKLAPMCAQCGTRVIGHGVEAGQVVFCCAHCAREAGLRGLKDRISEPKAGAGPARR